MTINKFKNKFGIPINLQMFAADTGADGIDSGEAEVADGEEELEDGEELEGDGEELEEGEEGEAADLQEKTKQSPEQDHAFAEMRRRLQDTERIAQQAKQELDQREQWVKQMFSQFGVKNWQDYQTRMENQIKQQREQQLKQAGVDPRLVEDLVKNDPELVKLKEQNETLQKQMQEQQESARLVGDYNELMKEFGEQFPELQDPSKIPAEVWQKYNQGYSLNDAFLVTQRGKIMEKTAAKTKQSTLNNINSKNHLKVESDGAKDASDVVIPKEVMSTFKEMGFNKKEAQQYYKKYYK